MSRVSEHMAQRKSFSKKQMAKEMQTYERVIAGLKGSIAEIFHYFGEENIKLFEEWRDDPANHKTFAEKNKL